MSTGYTRTCAWILACMILLSSLPVCAVASDPEIPTFPAAGEPDFPAASATESVPPEESIPKESLPEVFLPEESMPEESLPEESVPEETQPPETTPEEIQPPETTPEETQPSETVPAETRQPDILPILEEPEIQGPGLYFGLLHSHSNISDDTLSVEEAFAAASQTPGLDFFAVTDHSDSFDNHLAGAIGTDACSISTDWAAGKAAATAVTDLSFVGIYGYEMSWPANMQIGHISTFCTPGFQSWQQDAYKKFNGALQNYYDALSSTSGSISQFNHPGTQYGTFLDFEYSESADRAVTLMEIGSGSKACAYYITALDLGWHLAPTGSRDGSASARTVIYAQTLTEEGIYDALRQYRVYTSLDSDLEILYTMNGHFMGSRLKRRHIGDSIQISVSLNDPSDEAIGLVEVITNGGVVVAEQPLSIPSGTLDFALPVNSGYYFLRITQPDGDTAITAPIWLAAEESLGISDFTCETAIPVQNEAISLNLELYNGEDVDFDITSLEISADGIPLTVTSDLVGIPAGSNISHSLSITADCMGLTELKLLLTGMLEESIRTFETSLTVNFQRSEQVSSILVDGSHGNAGLDQLTHLKQMALAEQIQVNIEENSISPEALTKCRFLLVSAPSAPFSDTFLAAVSEFAGFGGSIIICGQSDFQDGSFHSAAELNRLLCSIGSSMRLKSDILLDPVTDAADPCLLFPDDINYESEWCRGISENQVYRFSYGCSLEPGNGAWLVRGRSTTAAAAIDNEPDGPIMLARESLSGGGTVFASGSLFLTDADLEAPKNIFDEPFANRSLAQNLLGIGGEVLPLSTIAQARTAAPGTLVRIRGYATTGTSNPYNTFPDMVYLQDDTGGIVITPFETENIQQGTPLEVIGFAGNPGLNRALKLSSFRVLDADLYQCPPATGSWTTLLDPVRNSQRLIQAEGTCLEIYCREEDTLAGCLLKDENGNTLRIKIEDYIFNGSGGENELHKKIRKNRTVRAIGLLHVDTYGETVLRVRNCEEVVWVPPRNYWNPKTGDFLLPHAMFCACSSLAALLLLKKQK